MSFQDDPHHEKPRFPLEISKLDNRIAQTTLRNFGVDF